MTPSHNRSAGAGQREARGYLHYVAFCLPLILAAAYLNMGQSSCGGGSTDKRPRTLMTVSSPIIFPDNTLAHTAAVPGNDGFFRRNQVDELCTGQNKVLCEWTAHPNHPRAYDMYAPRERRTEIESYPEDVEQTARCGSGETYAGICEDWLGTLASGSQYLQPAPQALTMFDIGVCSASIPTSIFINTVMSEFQKQADARLNTQVPPGESDVVLWLDFVFGLKDTDKPYQAWLDWTSHTDGYNREMTHGEIVVEGWYRVDGDISWSLDPEWLDDSWGGTFLSSGIQTTLYALGGWAAIFFGDCERDRDMAVQFKGRFEATDEGGVGLVINRGTTCGANGDAPCSWASIDPWPARPICNNKIKPDIESRFIDNLEAGMTDPITREPRCLTCTSDGGTLLPFQFDNGDPIPVKRVVLTPSQVYFVFLEDLLAENNYVYNELYARKLCNADREADSSTKSFKLRGEWP